MWKAAFLASVQRVTYALLCKPVLPKHGKPFEKVSAAIAVRVALCAKNSGQTTMFLVPAANASTARQVVAGLLVGNYAHVSGAAVLPTEEARALFKGDVLFVTTSVSECKSSLEDLPIGESHLSDLWDVVPLSKYASAKTTKPRVLLSNPGWAAPGMAGRRFGAVVIDAAHPRTLSVLPTLLSAATGCSDIRIVVAPPLTQSELLSHGIASHTDIWLWDPQAVADAAMVVTDGEKTPSTIHPRILWECNSDSEADRCLESSYKLLADVMRRSNGRAYPGLQMVWPILNRMRQLAVPLAQLEQVATQSWAGGLRQRMEALQEVDGFGNPVWDSTWPKLRESVESVYRMFLKREESAKYWSLAARLFELLPSTQIPIRVIVATQPEAALLLRQLENTVDEFQEACSRGVVEVVTTSEEAKLVAEGHLAHTLLLGPRSSAFRHLDVFPGTAVEEFLYPFEVPVENATLRRLFDTLEKLQSGETRTAYLRKLGLVSSKTGTSGVCRQAIETRRGSDHVIAVTTASHVDGILDLDELVTSTGADSHATRSGQDTDAVGALKGSGVEVRFERGGAVVYSPTDKLDVYFTATNEIQRQLVTALQPGWQVITFVDGRYDGLFRRLTETIQHRLPSLERISLELWSKAKAGLLSKYESKRALHSALLANGLGSGYETFAMWFKEAEEETLAPQQFDDFVILAQATGVFHSEDMIRRIFECVRHARGRNRAAGKALKSLLRAIVSGDGYEDALDSARKLDTALGDVLAAVEVLEVLSVRAFERNS